MLEPAGRHGGGYRPQPRVVREFREGVRSRETDLLALAGHRSGVRGAIDGRADGDGGAGDGALAGGSGRFRRGRTAAGRHVEERTGESAIPSRAGVTRTV